MKISQNPSRFSLEKGNIYFRSRSQSRSRSRSKSNKEKEKKGIFERILKVPVYRDIDFLNSQFKKNIDYFRHVYSGEKENGTIISSPTHITINKEKNRQNEIASLIENIPKNKKSNAKAKVNVKEPPNIINEAISPLNVERRTKIIPFFSGILSDPRKTLINEVLSKKLKSKEFIKLNLVLDLDETLVSTINKDKGKIHKILGEIEEKAEKKANKKIVKYKNDEDLQWEILVLFRPKLKEFLTKLNSYFEIFVYSHGEKKYVAEMIKEIDPEGLLINRNNIFMNNDPKFIITESTKKCLSKIGLEDDWNLRRTIIVDDLLQVWNSKYSGNILISKKFTPFSEYIDFKGKNGAFYILHEEGKERLNLERNNGYLAYPSIYTSNCIDNELIEDRGISQLELLSNQLISLALKYNENLLFFNDRDKLNTKNLIEFLYSRILKNKNIAFPASPNDKDKKLILDISKKLVEKMGGTVCTIDDTKADILILVDKKKEGEKKLEDKKCDKKLQEKKMQRQEKEGQQKKQEKKEGKKKLSAKWVSDCYFFLKEMNVEEYLIDSEDSN